jgi:hypothetical protein
VSNFADGLLRQFDELNPSKLSNSSSEDNGIDLKRARTTDCHSDGIASLAEQDSGLQYGAQVAIQASSTPTIRSMEYLPDFSKTDCLSDFPLEFGDILNSVPFDFSLLDTGHLDDIEG